MGTLATPIGVPQVDPQTAGVLQYRTAQFESLDQGVNEPLWVRLETDLPVDAIVPLTVKRRGGHDAVNLETFVCQQLQDLTYVAIENKRSVVCVVRLGP
jgi:hypothetical protein